MDWVGEVILWIIGIAIVVFFAIFICLGVWEIIKWMSLFPGSGVE